MPSNREYGAAHVKLRADWRRRIKAGEIVECSRCGELVHPWQEWDLDHDDDRRGYLGPAHAACNRAAGGRRSAQVRADAAAAAIQGDPSAPPRKKGTLTVRKWGER